MFRELLGCENLLHSEERDLRYEGTARQLT